MTDEERKQFCNVLRGSDGKYFASKAADEIENLDAARLNNEYQRDTALAELKDANERLEALAKRVEQLEALPPDNARWAIPDNHWTFR